jgi:hypothetical protein
MSTITKEQQDKIAEFVNTHELVRGLGSITSPCSVAAINLMVSGRLTDEIPDCMSEVIGAWTIDMQDTLTKAQRNSSEWKYLLPFAAGTGRDREPERLGILIDWLFGLVLPKATTYADFIGIGSEWRLMLSEKSEAAIDVAVKAAKTARPQEGLLALQGSISILKHQVLSSANKTAYRAASAVDVTQSLRNALCGVLATRSTQMYADFYESLQAPEVLRRMIAVTEPELMDGPKPE